MKTIYFVRHGESESNAGGVRSGADTPLTEKGYKQAAFIAERCAAIPVDAFIASSMLRAKETARVISEKINKNPESSDLFVERKYPSQFIGKPAADPETVRVEELMVKNFLTPGFRYADEENFEDIKERAEKALQFLADRPEDSILVVTHGYFLHILFGSAVFGKEFNVRDCDFLLRTLRTSNTGLTVFEYDKDKADPWLVSVWNDHAHLG